MPDASQIEVSIFGRGNGESVVIHVGSGKWLVVDSLMSDRKSVPLTYLEEIGVDVAQDVILVVASHWHDDHIKGISTLIDRAANSLCSFPAVLLKNEFLRFAAYFSGKAVGKLSSGVTELGHVIELMEKRHWQQFQFGQAWTTLARINAAGMAHGCAVEIEALSPSSFDQVSFLKLVTSFIPPHDVAIRAPTYDENDVSCAMHVRIGDLTIALGADLEKTGDNRSGWDAVFSSKKLTGSPANLLKIPHHGSVTGHHDEIWSKLCAPQPIASLTQWARGGHRLPTQGDVQRIRSLTSESYSASRTITSGDRHRLQAVNSVMKRTKSRIRRLDLRLGHIRHRFDGSVWTTDLFGSAVELKNVAA